MKRLAVFGLALALSACVAAPKKLPISSIPTRDNPAFSILSVIDGDTIKVSSQKTGKIVNARLMGYDTPETYRAGCAQEKALGSAATARLQFLLAKAERIVPYPNGVDIYGRVLLRLTLDGADVADTMIKAGLAVPYSGGKRINWCNRLGAT